ncbi:MAG: methyltransferase domain-containing protein [Ignavibacteria bacterium]|nr:methyltransferase domain-containing protein [Ignavibacteria bacterium]
MKSHSPLNSSLKRAQELFRKKNIPEAQRMCQELLTQEPTNAELLHLVGTIALFTGNTEAAIKYLSQACAVSKQANYFCDLGYAFLQMEKVNESLLTYSVAIRLKQDDAKAYAGYATALFAQQKLEEAKHFCEKAFSFNKNLAEAHYVQGMIYFLSGIISQSETSLLRAISAQPQFIDAQLFLGDVYTTIGKTGLAKKCYERALQSNPYNVQARKHLAFCYKKINRLPDAMRVLIEGINLVRQRQPLLVSLAEILKEVKFETIPDGLRNIFIEMCSIDTIDLQVLTRHVVQILKTQYAFPRLNTVLSSFDANEKNKFYSLMSEPDVQHFLNDALVLATLPRMVYCDIELENILTTLRSRILFSYNTSNAHDEKTSFPLLFAAQLACHCFLNEYVFFVTDDEEQRIQTMKLSIESQLSNETSNPLALEQTLVVYSLYAQLSTLQHRKRICNVELSQWNAFVQRIIQEQIINFHQEQELAATIPSLTKIENEISLRVREQYEENPYPRWNSIVLSARENFEMYLRRRIPFGTLPQFSHPVSILIAGCGTGRHPIHLAYKINNSSLIALDLSKASLSYAKRMAEHFHVQNIAFQQADILELHVLNKKFPYIESVGVLHHLHQPQEGLRALTNILEHNGIIKLGLYSQQARQHLSIAKELMTAHGLQATIHDLRKLRQFIIQLPTNAPLQKVTTAWDFYSLSMCRDLLMHVQEHTYTIPSLISLLDGAGLQFLFFETSATTANDFATMFPQEDAFSKLTNWEKFEEQFPDTFKGMYVFWCKKK